MRTLRRLEIEPDGFRSSIWRENFYAFIRLSSTSNGTSINHHQFSETPRLAKWNTLKNPYTH
ncbi:hypothetical protein THIOM_002257 [Candidatus Thiomargarita nelsonii]|uniref:Uncharacterized protein n=1 Tax=Candidatus Thiomargarita nelsonii TaxID=1003181 RepID=A0A176S1L4_9GAMM|nr:hypothetical protein THIOM_002257 [Candidatus Thiomargarita nelsonii]